MIDLSAARQRLDSYVTPLPSFKERQLATAMFAATARLTGLPEAALTGDSRTKRITDARMATTWAIRHLTGWSYPKIGRIIGRDHASVMNACRRIEERRQTDGAAAELTRALLDIFQTEPEQAA